MANTNDKELTPDNQSKDDSNSKGEKEPSRPDNAAQSKGKKNSNRTKKGKEEKQHAEKPPQLVNDDSEKEIDNFSGDEYYDGDSSLKVKKKNESKSASDGVSEDDSKDKIAAQKSEKQTEKTEEKQEPKKKGKKYDEKKMPFLEHLEELRWTILKSIIAVLVGAVGCFIFHRQIVDFLRYPGPEDLKLIYLSLTEGFMIYIKVSIFAGLVVALPFVTYEFWKFVVPGLLDKERKLVPPIVFFTVLCFLVGGAFAYLIIIPFAIKFLLGFQTEYLQATITIGKYLGFVVTLILVFGVVFELPVLSFFLSKIGLLTPDFLRSKRRYGIVTIFIIAAMLTPPDVMTQLMLAFPLIALYEISIWVSAVVAKQKAEREAEEED